MGEDITANQANDALEMALKCTNGDEAKAKAMIAGEYFDNIAIKCKYLLSGSNHSGLLLAFINIADEGYVSFFNTIDTSNSITFAQTDMNEPWTKFADEISTLSAGGFGTDLPGSRELFLNELSSADFIESVKERDELTINSKIIGVLKRLTGEMQVSSEVEIEPVSSLSMMQDGLLTFDEPANEPVPTEEQIDKVLGSNEQGSPDLSEFDAPTDGSMVEYTVDGNVVLSPVNGKYIMDVQAGDRILLTLDPSNPLALNVLKSLKAINSEGKAIPMVGIVIAKIPMASKGGTLLHAIIARGIIVRLFEADNLKIALAGDSGESTSEKVNEHIMYLMAGISLLVLLILLILIFR